MKNKVETIRFPVTKKYSSGEHTDNPVKIFYVTTYLSKLEKAITLSRGYTPGVYVNSDISVYHGTNDTFIEPKRLCYHTERVDILIPELYNFVKYDWLLKQIKEVEAGAKYTEYCLLQDSELIVFNNGTEDSTFTPNTLINGLSTILRTLFINNEGLILTSPTCGWDYLTHFVSISEEKPYKATLSDEAKRLIAEMKMKSTQNTATYQVLQGISNAIDSL